MATQTSLSLHVRGAHVPALEGSLGDLAEYGSISPERMMTTSSHSGTPASRRQFLAHLTPLAAGGAAFACPGTLAASFVPEQHGELLTASRRAMACRFQIAVPRQDGLACVEALNRALDCIDHVEQRLTIYRQTSEVSHVNRWAGRVLCRVSTCLAGLLERSRQIYEETGGAFDVAAGALVRCWKTHLAVRVVPPEPALAQARAASGMALVELNDRTVRFQHPALQLDFGGNGKGYALDEAARVLEQAGMACCLLSGSQSSMLAFGAPPWDAGWVVDVRDPRSPEKALAVLRLRDCAISTSGNVNQGITVNGCRYGHLIDPRSGRPVQETASVTVVAPTAERADALSTAFFTLGSEGIHRYCKEDPHVGALLVSASPSGDASVVQVIGAMANFVIEVNA